MKSMWLALCLNGLVGFAQAQTFRWVQAGTSNGLDSQINGLSQANGAVTATGVFSGSLFFDNQIVKSVGPTSDNALTGQFSAKGNVNWLQQSGGTPATTSWPVVRGLATASDAAGNSYVAYQVFSDALFGQTLVQVPANSQAAVVVKYDAAGQVLWAEAFAATLAMEVGALAVDASGTCWVTAAFAGQTVIGGKKLDSSRSSYNETDYLLLKLGPVGAVQWAKQIASSYGNKFSAIAVDATGNAYVAGRFYTNISFGPGVGFSSVNGGNMFVVKYDAMGNAMWAQRMGGPDLDWANGIAIDATGAVAVCGSFGNTTNGVGKSTAVFGSVVLATPGPYGVPNGFITKLDAQGTFLWTQAIRGEAFNQADAIALGPQGSFYVSGQGHVGTAIGSQVVTTGNGSPDGFVAKVSANGVAQWVTGYGGDGSDYFAGMALAADQQGHVYVGGAFYSSAQFGSIPASGYGNRAVAFVAQLVDDQVVLGTKAPKIEKAILQVYPNPAHTIVDVRWPAGTHPATLEIIDATGRTVAKTSIMANETSKRFPLQTLCRGIYTVRTTGLESMDWTSQRLLVD